MNPGDPIQCSNWRDFGWSPRTWLLSKSPYFKNSLLYTNWWTNQKLARKRTIRNKSIHGTTSKGSSGAILSSLFFRQRQGQHHSEGTFHVGLWLRSNFPVQMERKRHSRLQRRVHTPWWGGGMVWRREYLETNGFSRWSLLWYMFLSYIFRVTLIE